MGKIDQEKVQEFFNNMSNKSDKEILEIIKVRHEYQAEASEAVKKIALERGIVDEEMNEIQKELNNTDEWHYELKGKRYDGVSYSKISGLIKNETLSKETLVWKKGFDDWKQIKETELNEIFSNSEPPPLMGNRVSNKFIWLLAFAPILGFFIEVIYSYMVNDNELVADVKIADSAYWYLTVVLNILFAVLDDVKLKNAGHKTNNLVWAIFLIPVYLWKRANLTKQSKSYFWVWVISFIFSFILAAAFVPDIALSSDTPDEAIESIVNSNNAKNQIVQTNIEYHCPLCNNTSSFICPDCNKDSLIWCKNSYGSNISSIVCENCGFIAYPLDEVCSYCNKRCRSDAKYWTNRNGRNHSDCK